MYYAVSAFLPRICFNFVENFERHRLQNYRKDNTENVEPVYRDLLEKNSLLDRVGLVNGDEFATKCIGNTIFIEVVNHCSEIDVNAAKYLFNREIFHVNKLRLLEGTLTSQIGRNIGHCLVSVAAFSIARFVVGQKSALGISAGVSMLSVYHVISSTHQRDERAAEEFAIANSSRPELIGGLRWYTALKIARTYLKLTDSTFNHPYDTQGECISDTYSLNNRLGLIKRKLSNNPHTMTDSDIVIIKQLVKRIVEQHRWQISDVFLNTRIIRY